jgi:hypothetical protein
MLRNLGLTHELFRYRVENAQSIVKDVRSLSYSLPSFS